jgi:hypothetical protein
MEPDRLGHCMVYYRRWVNEPNQPIVTYTLRKHRDLGKETLEQYKAREEVPYEEAQKLVMEDVKAFGAPAEQKDGKDNVIYDGRWYYFPHIFPEDYAAGWYEKVEAMQGENNTYYAGEIMSFGDMDETAEYSHDLVERFF